MARKLGDCLPQFKTYESFYGGNKQIEGILYLFYKDILEFYVILLEFFTKKGMLNENTISRIDH